MTEDYPDRIAEMYQGCTVFISGGSGFLGKVLIEKLLRCTDVKKIYLLLRCKKGKTPKERLHDIFDNALFDLLKSERPNFLTRCKAITGDITEPNLGISDDNRKILENETNFIFHSAASTRFDDTMRTAVIMNTNSTKLMLELAKACKNLKLFVHVSTAYVCPKEEVLQEKFYDSPANPHEVLNSITWIKEDSMGKFTKELLGDMPNSYTFTKALAEGLVQEQVGKLPVLVVRPAVVIPIWKNPLPGWANNLQGPIGLFVGAGKGVLRTMHMDGRHYANLIPADSTINAILAATWDHLNKHKERYVYNLCTPPEDIQKSWEEIITLGKYIVQNEVPFNMILWYPGGGLTKSKVVHYTKFTLFQLLPALFIDLLFFIFGYKPILFNIQMRIHKGQEMFQFYTSRSWKFDTGNIKDMRGMLNAKEKVIYKMDVEEGLNINEYLINCILTCRRVNLKETDDMLPAARRNMKIMYVLDRVCKVLFSVLFIYYLYKVFIFATSSVKVKI